MPEKKDSWVKFYIDTLEASGKFDEAIRQARMHRMPEEAARLEATKNGSRLRAIMRNPDAPFTLRIESAKRLGWGVKVKGPEEKPRQVVLFHPPAGKPVDRIQFNPA